jgi:hypothetical protein
MRGVWIWMVAGAAALIAAGWFGLETSALRTVVRPGPADVTIELHDAGGPMFTRNFWGAYARISGGGRAVESIHVNDEGDVVVHEAAPGEYAVKVYPVPHGKWVATHEGVVRIQPGVTRVRATLTKIPQTFTCMPSTYFPTYYPAAPKPQTPPQPPAPRAGGDR